MIRMLSLCLVLLATTAHAQSGPRLSDRGRVLIAGQLGGWWENDARWRITLSPSASYFVTDHIGVGGYFAYTNERTEQFFELRRRSYELGVLSSNEIPLGERLGLWVLARAGYLRRDQDSLSYEIPGFHGDLTALPGLEPGHFSFVAPRNWLRFGLALPLVYQVNPHVGIGIGPDVGLTWSPSAEHTDVQLGMATWIPISI